MKFNLKELESLAIQPKETYTKEGQLYVRSSHSTWRKKPKGEPFSEKWCRLRGNLLFYFKGRDLSSGPQGVIVLEQVVIKADLGEVQPYAFFIEYIGEATSQYFAAHSAELRDEWIHALEKASYDHLRLQLHFLRKRLIARTGRDPIAEERHGVFGSNDISDDPRDEPILEMSMSCSNLPSISSASAPCTYVTIQCVTPPDTWWACAGKTEIVEDNYDPHFLTTIVFESRSNISPITRLRASVIQVEDRDTHKIVPLGQAICSIKDILTSPDSKFTMNFVAADGQRTGGTITLLLWQLEDPEDMGADQSSSLQIKTDGVISRTNSLTPVPRFRGGSVSSTISRRCKLLSGDEYLKNLFCCPITKTYRVPTLTPGEHIQVQEIMEETKLSYYVPAELLLLYRAEEEKRVEQLVKLGKMSDEWEKSKDAVVAEHFMLRTDYTHVLESVRKLQNKESQFKRSVDKGVKHLEFIPTNLHLQTLQVGTVDQRCKDASYDIITVGAPAAHSLKFKNGGLRRLIQQADSEGSRNTRTLNKQGQEIMQRIHATTPEVYQALQDLWDVANGHSVKQMKLKVSELKEKIDQLLQHLETPVIEQAYCSYYDATRTGSKPEKKTSKTSPQHSKSVRSAVRPNVAQKKSRPRTVWSTSSVSRMPSTKHSSLVGQPPNRQTSASSVHSDVFSDEDENSNRTPPSIQQALSSSTLPTLVFAHAPLPEVPRTPQSVQTSLIKKVLENLDTIHQAVDMLPEDTPSRERCQSIDQTIAMIKDDLKKLLDQVECAVTFLVIQDEYSHLDSFSSIQKRRDIVFAQAVTPLIAGVVTQLRRNTDDSQFLKQIYEIGLLVNSESLLSTYGDEMGMLEDMAVGVGDLERVQFQIFRGTEFDFYPLLSGSRNSVLVKLPLHPELYAIVEEAVGRETVYTKKISVKSVLFSIGVNEEQSLAELFGDTSLQDHINRENLMKLEHYYHKFKGLSHVGSDLKLDVPLSSLRHHVQSNSTKNVEILHVSSQLCRGMNAVRLTSCKSAKDRTAMSVTLEQCQILEEAHGLGPRNFPQLLDAMRSEGTRRDNARKNVGVYKYAFHKIQLKAFPKSYRPPEGTYGKAVAT